MVAEVFDSMEMKCGSGYVLFDWLNSGRIASKVIYSKKAMVSRQLHRHEGHLKTGVILGWMSELGGNA